MTKTSPYVTIGENGITMDDIMIHDETTEDTGIHMMLARMSGDLDPKRQEDLLHATVRRPDGRTDGQRQVQMRGRPAEQRGHLGDLRRVTFDVRRMIKGRCRRVTVLFRVVLSLKKSDWEGDVTCLHL